jgi:hypothetical protein
MERVQSKYPYKSFGENLYYNKGTQTYQTYTSNELDGKPAIYSTVPENWEFSPKRKGGRGYKRFKKALEMDSKKEEVMEREPVNIIINNFHSFIF